MASRPASPPISIAKSGRTAGRYRPFHGVRHRGLACKALLLRQQAGRATKRSALFTPPERRERPAAINDQSLPRIARQALAKGCPIIGAISQECLSLSKRISVYTLSSQKRIQSFFLPLIGAQIRLFVR